MATNNGTRPPVERCDIKFRNGLVRRDINPKDWRWTMNDPAFPANYDFDIIEWRSNQQETPKTEHRRDAA